MSSKLYREPIHLNIFNKGKLRKIEHHKIQINSVVKDLILATNEESKQSKTDRKHRKYYQLKRMQNRSEQIVINENQKSGGSQSHDFRAIHTASPFEKDQRYALRTATPKTRFQNSFLSSQITNKSKAKTLQQKYGSVQLRYPKINNPQKLQKSNKSKLYEQIYNPQYDQSKQIDEFYKYRHTEQQQKHNMKNNDKEVFHPISGVKILPFKRQMREVYQNQYKEKLLKYKFIQYE